MASLKALTLASVAVLALTRAAAAADLLPPPPAIEPLPPTAGPELGGWYLRGDIGAGVNATAPSLVTTPEPLNSPGLGAGANESFNNTTVSSSELFDVGFGYQYNTWLRGDITAEYRDGANFQSLYVLNNPNGANTQYSDFYRANISSAVGLANVYADLGTWYGMTPFLGVGVGVARNSLYGMTDQGGVAGGGPTSAVGGYFDNAAKINFAYAFMAGLDFNVTQNLKLELGYRYLNLGKFGSGASHCLNGGGGGNGFSIANCGGSNYFISSTNTLASNDFRIGLRWMIGDTFSPAPPPEGPLVRKY